MLFSKSFGTLVGTPSDISAPIFSELFSSVPDSDDPTRVLRAFFCVRTDRSTEASTLEEMAGLLDLFGRLRQAGVGLSELEPYLRDKYGLLPSSVRRAAVPKGISSQEESRVSHFPREKVLSKPASKKSKSVKDANVVAPSQAVKKLKPVTPQSVVSPLQAVNGSGLPNGWTTSQRFRSLTKNDSCQIIGVPKESFTVKTQFQVRWDADSSIQAVTLKTLKDRRRYEALSN